MHGLSWEVVIFFCFCGELGAAVKCWVPAVQRPSSRAQQQRGSMAACGTHLYGPAEQDPLPSSSPSGPALQVVPSTAIGFTLYDYCKSALALPTNL